MLRCYMTLCGYNDGCFCRNKLPVIMRNGVCRYFFKSKEDVMEKVKEEWKIVEIKKELG